MNPMHGGEIIGEINGDWKPRVGRLKNGNPAGDLAAVQRCGAKCRSGGSCKAPAMANGRCRMHGGLSTGPRTPEGLARSKKARWKHGRYSDFYRRYRAAQRRYGQSLREIKRIWG
jgi:hypothetical protein